MRDPTTSKLYVESLEEQRRHLEQHADAAKVDREVLRPIIELLLPRYADADAEARRNQRAYMLTAVWLGVLSALAVSLAVFQLVLVPALYQLSWLEVGVMVLALALMRVSRRQQWQRRWLHARHLAEQLRSAMFCLILPGGRAQPGPEPVQVLPFYESPDPELQEAVRVALQHERLEQCATDDLDAARTFLSKAWIEHQADFHRDSFTKRERQTKQLHSAASAFFVVTLIASALHAFGVGHGEHGEHLTPMVALGLSTALITIALPAWGGAFHGIGELFEWERIGQRSRRMAEILREKAKAAEAARTFDELRTIVAEAEWIMAIENYEWLMALGFRHPTFK